MNNGSGFIAALSRLLTGDPLCEKILLAPTHRVGRQWLDQAAAVTGGIANVRSATISRLVLDYAEDELRRRNLRVASAQEKIRLVGVALMEIAAEAGEEGYFSRLPAGVPMTEALLSTLEELESAMVQGTLGVSSAITPPAKAAELSALIRRYAAAKRTAGVAGQDDINRAAIAGLARHGAGFPLLLIPASVGEEFNALQWGFVSRWPENRRITLPGPEDGNGGELSFFAADSIANEAREVFRRLQADGISLDTAEVVCLDAEYASALCAVALESFDTRPEDLPLTFNSGIPGHYSRPGRLLAAWLEWLEQGLPPEGLARMLDAGLTGEGWLETAPGVSAEALAARLRFLPIIGGADEYRRRLGTGDGALAAAETWLNGWLREILPLAPDSDRLDVSSAEAVLGAAERLLRSTAGRDAKLDAYARRSLIETIRLWLPYADWPGFEPLPWLREVTENLRVMGLGPLPGRLHVGDLATGGQSGREHLFIMGLDDRRHPGGVRQDPVLLDKERRGVSSGLIRSHRRRERREKALGRLLARHAGKTTLSYSRSDDGGREQFPAGEFTRLLKRSSGKVAGVTLRPATTGGNLNHRDDWLTVLLSGKTGRHSPLELESWHPGLAGGEKARLARLSSTFTAYDGNVPEAGEFWRREDRALSPTELETLAACPLDFFFKKLLGLSPPERYEPLPGRWLPGNARGNLLHDLFQDFLVRLSELDQPVTPEHLEEQEKLLRHMLDEAIRRERRRTPAHDALAGLREEWELSEACAIFLDNEVMLHRKGRPLCLEAALGGAREHAPPWNRSDPVELILESGTRLLLRGRVDRIDRLHDGGGLMIIDYKTGRSDKFSPDDPFRQGRNLQPLLYTRMLERVVEESGGGSEPVCGFAYFFPMPRDEGRTIAYTREMLDRHGMAIVETLCDMLASGRFPFSSDENDVKYSDYAPMHGDAAEMARAARIKALMDPALEDWAGLRELSPDEEDGDAE